MKMLECTAMYKMGHSWYKLPTVLAVRNINYVQKITEEVPEFTDGANSMISLPNGERFMATDKYEDLSERYKELMESEE